MAAGKGVRLETFTLTRPKHLMPVAGSTLLEHTLRSIRSAGIGEVILVTHYMKDLIRSHIGDGSLLGLKVTYVEQQSLLGTGDALLACKSLIGAEPFLLVYGDLAFHPSIPKEVISFFEKGLNVILGVHADNVKDFGLLEVADSTLLGIREKPKVGGPGIVNGGIYILNQDIFGYIEKTPRSERGELELTSAINMAIADGKKFAVYPTTSVRWVDVGRPWDVLDANRMLLDALLRESRVEGSIEENVRIHGNVVIEPNTKILSGTYIEGPVWISSGCKVGPNCYLRPYTYLCQGVRVGNACEIKGSIIMNGTHIGHLSYIGDSIIGADCNIGAGTITANLRFDDLPIKVTIKGERVSSGKRKLGAFLGDGVKTGINVSLYPGVKVGPGSWIAPHIAVNRDVPPNALLTQKFELQEKEIIDADR
ncbi:MAG: bifunctional sugar-1-phosphate nucleotidylyltransferase/acetyltransferase [Candidatus Methanomethylicaceae archaeon]